MAHDLSAAEAHERLPGRRAQLPAAGPPAHRPPSGLPSTMGLRLVAAIYEQPRRISGPGPGQPAVWLTACAEPSAEVTANAALAGRIGEGLGWPWLVTVRLLCQLGA